MTNGARSTLIWLTSVAAVIVLPMQISGFIGHPWSVILTIVEIAILGVFIYILVIMTLLLRD